MTPLKSFNQLFERKNKLPCFGHPHRGIYFLFNKNKIVYIGRTKNLYERLCDHQKRLNFDGVTFIRSRSKELGKLESQYIYHYKPKYNQLRGIGIYFKSLRQTKKLIEVVKSTEPTKAKKKKAA